MLLWMLFQRAFPCVIPLLCSFKRIFHLCFLVFTWTYSYYKRSVLVDFFDMTNEEGGREVSCVQLQPTYREYIRSKVSARHKVTCVYVEGEGGWNCLASLLANVHVSSPLVFAASRCFNFFLRWLLSSPRPWMFSIFIVVFNCCCGCGRCIFFCHYNHVKICRHTWKVHRLFVAWYPILT